MGMLSHSPLPRTQHMTPLVHEGRNKEGVSQLLISFWTNRAMTSFPPASTFVDQSCCRCGISALITASATLCPSGLPRGSLRRTEGGWRDLDSFEDCRKHRPGFLAKKPLRRGRSIRTREEKVVYRGQATL